MGDKEEYKPLYSGDAIVGMIEGFTVAMLNGMPFMHKDAALGALQMLAEHYEVERRHLYKRVDESDRMREGVLRQIERNATDTMREIHAGRSAFALLALFATSDQGMNVKQLQEALAVVFQPERAFCAGWDARGEAKPETGNPYVLDTYVGQRWLAGWQAHEKVVRAEMQGIIAKTVADELEEANRQKDAQIAELEALVNRVRRANFAMARVHIAEDALAKYESIDTTKHDDVYLKLEAAHARIAGLEQTLVQRSHQSANLYTELHEAKERIRELEQEILGRGVATEEMVNGLIEQRHRLAEALHGQYRPIQPGTLLCSCDEDSCDSSLTLEEDGKLTLENDAGYWGVYLPEGHAICAVVPGEPAPVYVPVAEGSYSAPDGVIFTYVDTGLEMKFPNGKLAFAHLPDDWIVAIEAKAD